MAVTYNYDSNTLISGNDSVYYTELNLIGGSR